MAESESQVSIQKKKRPRGKNFSPQELECLVVNVEKNNVILNSKFTDTVTNQRKQKIWISIAKAVSSVSSVDRTSEEIRTRFTKMKSEVKKKAGIDVRERQRTGGGAETKQSYTNIENKVLDILGETAVQGVKGGLDTDSPNSSQVPVPDAYDALRKDILQEAMDTAAISLTEDGDVITGDSVQEIEEVREPKEPKERCLNQEKPLHVPKKRSATEELVEIEKEKLILKKRKLDVLEKISSTLENNAQIVSDIRDFLFSNKESLFMPLNVCSVEQ